MRRKQPPSCRRRRLHKTTVVSTSVKQLVAPPSSHCSLPLSSPLPLTRPKNFFPTPAEPTPPPPPTTCRPSVNHWAKTKSIFLFISDGVKMFPCRDSDTESGFTVTALSLLLPLFSFLPQFPFEFIILIMQIFIFCLSETCILLQFFLSRLVFHPALPPHADR